MTRALQLFAAVGVVAVIGIGIRFVIDGSRVRNLHGPIGISRTELPKHGFLGIEFETEPRNPPTIKRVILGSFAAQAGLQERDVVIAIQDQSDPKLNDIFRVMQSSEPDSTMRLTIRRQEMEVQLNVRLRGFIEMLELREREKANAVGG